MRRTILIPKTPNLYSGYAFWQQPAYFDIPFTICKDSAQLMVHRQYNPTMRTFQDVKVYIDLPNGFSLMDLGKRDYLNIGENMNNPQLEISSASFKRDGTEYKRYILNFEEELVPGDHRRGKNYYAYTTLLIVKAEKDIPDRTVFYSTQIADKGTVTSLENPLEIDVFPALEAFALKGRHIQLVVQRRLTYFSPEELDALLATFHRAGIDEIGCATDRTGYLSKEYKLRLKKVINKIHKHGIKALIHQEDWGMDYFAYDGTLEHSAYDADGNIYTQYYPRWRKDQKHKITLPCPTWLIKEGRQRLKEQIYWAIKEYKADGYIRSVELGGTQNYCFNDRCIEEFRKFAHLPNETQLNPKTIKNKFWDKWLDFRRYQNAEITHILHEGVRMAGEDKLLYAYSALQSKRTLNRYMTDWRYYPGNCDIVIAGIGGSIEKTREALDGWPWMGRVGTYAYVNKKANDLIYDQFVSSGNLGIRIFEFMQTTGATYYLCSLLARYGEEANQYMPEGYEIKPTKDWHISGCYAK